MKGGMGETMNQQQPIRPSKNLQDQRVRRTFHVLLKALEKLLCEMPLEELTIKKICETAHIQRTTFYQHFHDMHDFLDWYILQKQNEFRSFASSTITSREPHDAYLEVAQCTMRYLSQNERLVKRLMNTQINGKPLFELYVTTCVDELKEKLNHLPEVEKHAGNTPISFLAEFYVGGLISVFRWWIVNDKPVTEEEFMNYLRLRVERMD